MNYKERFPVGSTVRVTKRLGEDGPGVVGFTSTVSHHGAKWGLFTTDRCPEGSGSGHFWHEDQLELVQEPPPAPPTPQPEQTLRVKFKGRLTPSDITFLMARMSQWDSLVVGDE